LTLCARGSTVGVSPGSGRSGPDDLEDTMSSTASLITVLASVAFALIVIAVVVRVAPPRAE